MISGLWFTYYNHVKGVNVCMCAPRPTSLPPCGLWQPASSSAHGIFQVRILVWAAISSSRGNLPPRAQNPHLPGAGSFFTEPSGSPQCTPALKFPAQATNFIPYSSAFNCMFHRALGFWGDAQLVEEGQCVPGIWLLTHFSVIDSVSSCFTYSSLVWNLA